MAGPARWWLLRIDRLPKVLLWWPGSYLFPDPTWLSRSNELDRLPQLREWLRHAGGSASRPVCAAILDMNAPHDCRVLWEVMNHVSLESIDFYVSDEACREVYLLHHHDKIVVSIPDEIARQALLDELAARPDVFEDCSGYTFEQDEEYETE